MKLLCVSATVPPGNSATADILGKVLPLVQKAGWQVDCVSVKSRLKAPERTVYQGMNIFHANYLLYLPKDNVTIAERVLDVWKRVREKNDSGSLPFYKEQLVQAFLKEMERCGAESYDAIMAVCAYYSAAEAVRRFAERHQYKGKLVLYQVDPLTDNKIYSAESFRAREEYEKNIQDTWDAVLTTPLIERFWRERRELHNVHAVEFPVIRKPEKCQGIKKEEGEIRCVFAGFLYPELRNPQYTLELFSHMRDPNIRLYILGNGMESMLEEYKAGKLAGRLYTLGSVSSDVCNAWLESADVLVNIGNSVSNQVPSKLFQYLNYGKPILNLCKVAECPTLPYLERYPLALNLTERELFDPAEVKRAEDWIREKAGERIPFEWISRQYFTCTPEYVSEVLLQSLQK